MESNVKKYWSEAAKEYRETAYKYADTNTRYPFYEVRLNLVNDLLRTLTPGRLLDAGCGGANVLRDLLRGGWDGYGCDLVEEMVALGRENLAADGQNPDRVCQAPLWDLGIYEDASFDVVLSLGVMEYIRPDEERRAFAEIRRVLKGNGVFLVENINELFDLTTFNRFTLDFFADHFLPCFFSGEEIPPLRNKLSGLVTNPEKPSRSGRYATTRDQVFTKAENPLAYGEKVREYGFRQSELAFYRFHAVPPLLFESQPELEKVSIPFELKYSRHWIGHFLASGFVSVLRKA